MPHLFLQPTVIQLDRVEVKNVGTGEVSVFPVTKPDGSTVATATADNNWTLSLKKYLAEVEYKVRERSTSRYSCLEGRVPASWLFEPHAYADACQRACVPTQLQMGPGDLLHL